MSTMFFVVLITLFSSSFSVFASQGMTSVLLEKYCICHAEPSKDGIDYTTEKFVKCSEIVSSEYATYLNKNENYDLKGALSKKMKDTDSLEDKDALCSKKQVKKWIATKYKGAQEDKIEELKRKIQIGYCGLKESEPIAKNEHDNCFDRLNQIINDTEVTTIKDECSDSNLNKTKKTRKNCVEIEKSKYILALEKNEDKSLDLYPFICKKGSEGEISCLDDITTELSKVDCSDFDDLTTKPGQEICRKIILAPKLKVIANADNFKSCIEKSNQVKQKAACFNNSKGTLAEVEGARLEWADEGTPPPPSTAKKLVNEAAGIEESGDETKAFKEKVKGKISDSQIKSCTKAYKKLAKSNADATFDKAVELFNAEGCDIEAALDAIHKGGNACYTKLASYEKKVDTKFFGRLQKACELGADEKETQEIVACYDLAQAEKDKKESKNKWATCINKNGLGDKYALRDWSDVLKEEFQISGCEDSVIASKFSTLYDGTSAAYPIQMISSDYDRRIQNNESLSTGLVKNDQEKALACFDENIQTVRSSRTGYDDCLKKSLKTQCQAGRVGQELAKATLAELAKEGGMIGALASVGISATSCIPPRGTKSHIENAEDFCANLNVGWGTDTQYATPERMNECKQRVKDCNQYKSKSDIFYACGMKIVGCVLERSKAPVNGNNITFNEQAACNVSNMEQSFTTQGTDPNGMGQNKNYVMGACLAGAALSGVNAITSAICANKKKYPKPEDQDACLKKMQMVNSLAQAGAVSAQCLSRLPGNPDNKTPLAESQRLEVAACMTSQLGPQAVDAIAKQMCAKKATQAEKDECMRKADIAKVGVKTAAGIINCQQAKKAGTNKDGNISPEAANVYKACLAKEGIGAAADLLSSQVCEKQKDPQKCKMATIALKAAGGMVMCAPMTDQKAKSSCMAAQALNAMGEVPGPIGEVAKIASTGITIMNGLNNCAPGDSLCKANILANQLPGDSKIYVGLAIQGRSLLKRKNVCNIPSERLYKASQATKLFGDLTTALIHKVETEKMKKDFGDLIDQKKSEEASGTMFGAIESFVNRNNADREKAKDEAREQQFATQAAANDAQLRGLQFALKNENLQLTKFRYERPFIYTSAALNTAGQTMATFEAMAEQTYTTLNKSADANILAANTLQTANAALLVPPLSVAGAAVQAQIVSLRATAKGQRLAADRAAPWKKKCIDLKKDLTVEEQNNATPAPKAGYLKPNKVKPEVLHASFKGLSNSQAYANYVDWENYIEGERTYSLTLEEIEEFRQFDVIETPKEQMSLAKALAFTLDFTTTVLPQAEAFDAFSLVNIGVSTAGALFPGSGGFSQGTPMGHAENIAMLFVRKGMEKACPPADPKTAENNFCKMQGAIDFAARKAVQVILKKNKAEIDKFMHTPAGRIMIGAKNTYDLYELIKQNEAQLKGQKERVHYLCGQVNVMKPDDQPTKELCAKAESVKILMKNAMVKPEPKMNLDWQKFIDQFLIEDAHASVSKNDDLKVCLTKSALPDYTCGCSKAKGCYSVFDTENQAFQMNMKGMASKLGPTFNETMNPIYSVANSSNQLLTGAIGTEQVDLMKMKNATDKLNSLNNRLLEEMNKKLVKAKQKPFDLKTSIANYENGLFSTLAPEIQTKLGGVNLASLSPDFKMGTSKAPVPSTTKNVEIDSYSDKDLIQPISEVASGDEINASEQFEKEQEKIQNEAMNVEYEFKAEGEINNNSDHNIFKVISARYSKKMKAELETEVTTENSSEVTTE